MKQKSKNGIVDTSCLILLHKVEELKILKHLFDEIYITSEIKNEFGEELPKWIKIDDPKDDTYKKVLEIEIDKGEASALALSIDLPNSIIVLDDQKARKVAFKINLSYTGTFGLLLRAKKNGIIKELRPILEKIRNTNFRFSDKLFVLLLKEAGE